MPERDNKSGSSRQGNQGGSQSDIGSHESHRDSGGQNRERDEQGRFTDEAPIGGSSSRSGEGMQKKK